ADLEKISTAKAELHKRSKIVSALRSKTLATQADLKNFLQKQKKSGEVEDYESFYIVNAMAITSTKEVMEEIAEFDEVQKILPNRTRQLYDKDGSTAKQNNKKAAHKAENSDIAPNIERLGAPEVWEEGIDGSG